LGYYWSWDELAQDYAFAQSFSFEGEVVSVDLRPGNYTVTLTVGDLMGNSSSTTEFMQVDALAAGFDWWVADRSSLEPFEQ